MELHTLTHAPGAKKTHKRKGRGQGSGKGGTATKGHKGAQSRSGHSINNHRQSGYTPLQRRKPKFGFKNPNRKDIQAINLKRIDTLAAKHNLTEITPDLLAKHGIIKKQQTYKILAQGTLTHQLTIQAPLFSLAAQKAIEKTGSSIQTS